MSRTGPQGTNKHLVSQDIFTSWLYVLDTLFFLNHKNAGDMLKYGAKANSRRTRFIRLSLHISRNRTLFHHMCQSIVSLRHACEMCKSTFSTLGSWVKHNLQKQSFKGPETRRSPNECLNSLGKGVMGVSNYLFAIFVNADLDVYRVQAIVRLLFAVGPHCW